MTCQLRNIVHHIHLPAITPYNWALKLQQALATKVASDNTASFLLTLEHKPVYTVGLRKDSSYNDALYEKLKLRGAEVFKIDRGGLITFHGPGQLVAYPIIHLKQYAHITGVRCYVDSLHNILLSTCFGFGVPAKLDTENVGIFVGQTGKIASIGVQCRRFVTVHGIALNCNTDLSWFDHIVACGLADKQATSLSKELQRDVKVEEVLPVFLTAFAAVFKCNLVRDSSYLKKFPELHEK